MTEHAAIALVNCLFIKDGEVLDIANKRVATVFEVSAPEELHRLQPENVPTANIVINLLDWQVCWLLTTS